MLQKMASLFEIFDYSTGSEGPWHSLGPSTVEFVLYRREFGCKLVRQKVIISRFRTRTKKKEECRQSHGWRRHLPVLTIHINKEKKLNLDTESLSVRICYAGGNATWHGGSNRKGSCRWLWSRLQRDWGLHHSSQLAWHHDPWSWAPRCATISYLLGFTRCQYVRDIFDVGGIVTLIWDHLSELGGTGRGWSASWSSLFVERVEYFTTVRAMDVVFWQGDRKQDGEIRAIAG